MKKAILLGDYGSPQWHPLAGVDEEIRSVLGDGFELEITENYGTLGLHDLERFDLCILYVDRWADKTSPELVHAFLSWVSGGGGILGLHNGIILKNDHELAAMMGGRFTSHPKYRELEFRITRNPHPVTDGLTDFRLSDEPYRFELDPFVPRTLLVEYELEGEAYPAAWAHTFGKGRVAYLAPGHSKESFTNDGYRALIRRGADWASGLLP